MLNNRAWYLKALRLLCSRGTCKFSLLLLALTAFTLAEASPRQSKACFQEASTELEELYCTIQLKGGGKTLPRFSEFRRNNHTTQRLLLKREAEALSLALPKRKTKSHKKSEHRQKPQLRRSSVLKPTQQNQQRPSNNKRNDNITLQSCSLNRETITCNEQRYALQSNIPLRQLSRYALSKENALRLPEPTQEESERAQSIRYLSRVYPIYIEKMLVLGRYGKNHFGNCYNRSVAV